MQAKTAEQKTQAIHDTVTRIKATLAWLQQHSFQTPTQLAQWEHLVRFQGRDSDGRPILVVRITKACAECHGKQADQVVDAIMSHVRLSAQHTGMYFTHVWLSESAPELLLGA